MCDDHIRMCTSYIHSSQELKPNDRVATEEGGFVVRIMQMGQKRCGKDSFQRR